MLLPGLPSRVDVTRQGGGGGSDHQGERKQRRQQGSVEHRLSKSHLPAQLTKWDFGGGKPPTSKQIQGFLPV